MRDGGRFRWACNVLLLGSLYLSVPIGSAVDRRRMELINNTAVAGKVKDYQGTYSNTAKVAGKALIYMYIYIIVS